MLTMKFIKETESRFAIYEIPESLKKKYNGNYIMTVAPFSDYAVHHFDDEEIINELREYNYEGVYETVREAEMTAKYAETMDCLRNLLAKIKMFNDDIEYFKKREERITKGE